jgi:hypothetical protein
LELSLEGEKLRFKLRMEREGGVQAKEVLAKLGLDDLESQGFFITRTELALRQSARPVDGPSGLAAAAHGCTSATDRSPATSLKPNERPHKHETRDADQRRTAGRMPHRDR